MLYAEHIERTGVQFFRLACEQDLEGIVLFAAPLSLASLSLISEGEHQCAAIISKVCQNHQVLTRFWPTLSTHFFGR